MSSEDEPAHVGAVFDEWSARYAAHDPAGRAQVNRIGERAKIDYELRKLIFKRDGWHCKWCFWSPASFDTSRHLELDHIQPWSEGGTDTSDNLRTLCSVCNQDRSNANADRYMVNPLPVMASCYPCLMDGAHKPNDGAIPVYCGTCGRSSWTIAAYPPN